MLINFFQAINDNPLYLILWLAVFIAPMIYLRRRLGGLHAAEIIIKEQFNPIPKTVIEQGFNEFKGEELKRYKALVLRIRSQHGHDGFKVGHMAWILQILDDKSIDVETVDIPSFIKEKS